MKFEYWLVLDIIMLFNIKRRFWKNHHKVYGNNLEFKFISIVMEYADDGDLF